MLFRSAILVRFEPGDGTSAAELAAQARVEKDLLKRNIRKLKEIGLTESLVGGYRLSPRGKAFMKVVDS